MATYIMNMAHKMGTIDIQRIQVGPIKTKRYRKEDKQMTDILVIPKWIFALLVPQKCIKKTLRQQQRAKYRVSKK